MDLQVDYWIQDHQNKSDTCHLLALDRIGPDQKIDVLFLYEY